MMLWKKWPVVVVKFDVLTPSHNDKTSTKLRVGKNSKTFYIIKHQQKLREVGKTVKQLTL